MITTDARHASALLARRIARRAAAIRADRPAGRRSWYRPEALWPAFLKDL